MFPPFVPPDKYSIVIDSGFFAPNRSSEQDKHDKSIRMANRMDMAIDDFFIYFPLVIDMGLKPAISITAERELGEESN